MYEAKKGLPYYTNRHSCFLLPILMILQMYCFCNTFASVYNALLRIRNSGQRMDASLPDCFSFCMPEIHFCFIPVRDF